MEYWSVCPAPTTAEPPRGACGPDDDKELVHANLHRPGALAGYPGRRARDRGPEPGRRARGPEDAARPRSRLVRLPAILRELRRALDLRDRKSTRLNSSH